MNGFGLYLDRDIPFLPVELVYRGTGIWDSFLVGLLVCRDYIRKDGIAAAVREGLCGAVYRSF